MLMTKNRSTEIETGRIIRRGRLYAEPEIKAVDLDISLKFGLHMRAVSQLMQITIW